MEVNIKKRTTDVIFFFHGTINRKYQDIIEPQLHLEVADYF
jgi:hypothetical protein